MQLRALLALACTAASFVTAHKHDGLFTRQDELQSRQLEAAKRLQPSLLERRQSSDGKNLTFSNPKALDFWVNGSAIPEVDWDIGDSYAGLMPISDDPNETRKVKL
jgi:carboxypeptidase D